MEQDIRFLDVDGHRLAYATVGEGPLLILGRRWVSHLEAAWEDAALRGFLTELGQNNRVVRFDRFGTGLSERDINEVPSLALDVRTLAAVQDVFGDEKATLLGMSCSAPSIALYTRDHPDRVRALVFFGAAVSRHDLPPHAQASLIEFVRSNWGLGAQVLASVFIPRASGDRLAELSRYLRGTATGEAAAAFL